MGNTVLTNMDFNINFEDLSAKMRVKKGSSFEEQLRTLVEEAKEVANIKAVYKMLPIEEKGEDFVVIGGRKFVRLCAKT